MPTQLSYLVHDAEGRFIGRLWIYEDVTRERQTAEQLIYLAERDSLTGLYNRHRFQIELGRMLSETERRHSQGRCFSSTWTNSSISMTPSATVPAMPC